LIINFGVLFVGETGLNWWGGAELTHPTLSSGEVRCLLKAGGQGILRGFRVLAIS
jgi:hypothetical protein